MALKYTPKPKDGLPDSYTTESAHLNDYLRQMLAEYESHLAPLKELRKDLQRQLKEQSLSLLVRQLREDSAH